MSAPTPDPAGVDVLEAIYTMRAIRRWTDEPVDPLVVRQVIEAATKAPSGTNRQPWAFIVVMDDDDRAQIARQLREREESEGVLKPWRTELQASPSAQRRRIISTATALFEHLDAAPVFILPCLDWGDGQPLEGLSAGRNIYPAVQNLLLAARGLGLGAVLTGAHRLIERELRELLGFPQQVKPVALIPLGHPDQPFGPTSRRPVDDVTHWGRWGSSFPTGAVHGE